MFASEKGFWRWGATLVQKPLLGLFTTQFELSQLFGWIKPPRMAFKVVHDGFTLRPECNLLDCFVLKRWRCPIRGRLKKWGNIQNKNMDWKAGKIYKIEEKKLKITKVQLVFLEVKIRRGYQTFEALAYLENSDGWMFSPSGMSPLFPFSRQPQGPLPRGKLMKRLFHSFKFSSPFKALHLCILCLTWYPFVLVVWFPIFFTILLLDLFMFPKKTILRQLGFK